jgi:two-component system NarL family sensor kinase
MIAMNGDFACLAPRGVRRMAGRLTYAVRHMTKPSPGFSVAAMLPLPSPAPPTETASDLRALYRASEARAARLRVLVEASRTLAASAPGELDAAAQTIADQAAHLAGYAQGAIASTDNLPRSGELGEDSLVIPLEAPGSGRDHVGMLVLEQRVGSHTADDREALGILGQLVGGALAAHAREARLATLLAELLGAQEAERSRVAHELHDGVAQTAAALARRLDLATDGDPEDLVLAARQARGLVRELRQVISGMRPPVLDDLGLAAALRQLIEDAGAAQDVTFDVKLGARPPTLVETAMFRIVQEGLNNARAHAGAGAHVTIRVSETEGHYRVEIRDNGAGFDPRSRLASTTGRGLGLSYMRERINRLGGTLVISSAPGQGCRIIAEIPAR